MLFYLKLNFLMELTNTSNSQLAKHLSLDPSYISRIRRGERNMPKYEQYAYVLAAFFSKLCVVDYQRAALSEKLQKPEIKELSSQEDMKNILSEWLLNNNQDQSQEIAAPPMSTKKSVGNILSDFMLSQGQTGEQQSMITYYGTAGKRRATIALFNLALSQTTPKTLLLYSDDDVQWIKDNPVFYAEWCQLLQQVIVRGHKIKIIHKVSRNIYEMLSIIQQWLPFYITGSVEPYYYPKLRDGVYKRTLYVLSDVAAMFSTSIGNDGIDLSPNFMSTDRQVVDSFKNEFYSYLALCKPVLKIHNTKNKDSTSASFLKFQSFDAPQILKSEGLSGATMTLSVLEAMFENSNEIVSDSVKNSHLSMENAFLNGLKTNQITHILWLENTQEILLHGAASPHTKILGHETLRYTARAYALHLEHIVALMEKYPNFSVLIDQGENPRCSIYAVEDCGVLVTKTNPETTAFEIAEPTMVSAFWEYMSELHQEYFTVKRHVVMETLRQQAQELLRAI